MTDITDSRQNLLGAFMRAQRKELRLRLSDVADKAGLTASYISKLELGQITDGPSVGALERIAKVLDVPVTQLTRLKEQETALQASPPPAKNNRSNEDSLALNERRLIQSFRACDERVQLYLIAQVQLAQRSLRQEEGISISERAISEIEDNTSDNLLYTTELSLLADSYMRMGFKFMHHKQTTAALQCYQEAKVIYQRAQSEQGKAFVHYHLGRAFIVDVEHLASDAENKREKALYHFEQAIEEFDRAMKKGQVEAKYYQHYPETIAKCAEVKLRQLDAERYRWSGKGADTALSIPETEQEVFQLAMQEIDSLQQQASRVYQEWSAALKQNLDWWKENTENEYVPDDLLNMLAEAHHRHAVLLREIAGHVDLHHAASFYASPQDAIDFGNRMAELSFVQWRECIQWRLHLARRYFKFDLTDANRSLYLNRLSNSHQEWGYSIDWLQNKVTRPPRNDHSSLETCVRALYQYRISGMLNEIYPSDYDPLQVEHLKTQVQTLEQDCEILEDTSTVVGRMIRSVLETATDWKKLQYPIEYTPSSDTRSR